MEKEFTPPVKEVALAGFHVRCRFVFIFSRDELAVFFFHFTKEVVQFRGVFAFQKILDQLPGVCEPAGLNVCQRQIVAVIVGGRIDLLGLFEERRGVGDLAGANVGFAQVVIGVEVARVKLDRFLELLGSEVEFAKPR